MDTRIESITSVVISVAILGISCCCTAAHAQTINEKLKLLAADRDEGDQFGRSIDTDGILVAVGASEDEDNGFASGAAYLFDAKTGAQVRKLLPEDGAASDKFGWSIAIDDGIVAVGAIGDNYPGSDWANAGAVYLFDAATGAQIHKLAVYREEADEQFGVSVDIDGGILVVGARYFDNNSIRNTGLAYTFDIGSGSMLATLAADDGASDDLFGESVAIDQGLVVVGATGDDDAGESSGSVYLFDAISGTQVTKLTADDGESFSLFGAEVGISGASVVVGAPADSDNGSFSGSAYLFDTMTGAQVAKLLPSEAQESAYFGTSVSIDGETILVGASWMDLGRKQRAGVCYQFDATSGEQVQQLIPSDSHRDAFFGSCTALHAGLAAIGADGDYDGTTRTGSAYVFETGCAADLDGDGIVDTRDFIEFLNAWAAGDVSADWNDDGIVNTQDFIAYLNDWAQGCP